jgi:NADH dehydrogenase
MNIFLAGASGYVGLRVLQDLVAAGHDVVALVHSDRSADDIVRINRKVTVVKGDVSNPGDMLKAVSLGIDVLIYLPGLLREFPGKSITFRSVHVDGVRNLLAAARQSGVTRWIQMSALGVGANSATGYYQTKWEAEQLVRASNIDWTILRPSLIFDDRPRKQHNFVDELAKAIKTAPFIPIIGDGTFLFQPVSVDDVSQTIVQSLAKPETIGKTYEIGGMEKITYRELVLTIAHAMGTKKPPVRIPLWLMMMLGRFPFFPISRGEVVMLSAGNYVHDPNEERTWREMFVLPMKRFSESVPKSLAK